MGFTSLPGARLERLVGRLGPAAGPVLLWPVVVVAAPLWWLSALTRWLSGRRLLEPPSFPEQLVEYEPVLGARTRPNLDTLGRAQDVFRLTTDAEGWRGQAALDEADVVAFGDSFAFGYGVDDADVYTEQAPGLSVKAVASVAYSMVHGLLWMRRLAPRLRGKTVVWLVYCGNDLADNLRPNQGRYRMPFVRGEPGRSWELVTDHVSPQPWPFASPRSSNPQLLAEFSTPSWYSRRVFAAADFLIAEAARTCDEAGARLVVLSVPHAMQVKEPARVAALSPDPEQVDLGLPDRCLAQSCAERAVPFEALEGHLRPGHYFREDMHWNPRGHRVVASLVADLHHRYAPDSD